MVWITRGTTFYRCGMEVFNPGGGCLRVGPQVRLVRRSLEVPSGGGGVSRPGVGRPWGWPWLERRAWCLGV